MGVNEVTVRCTGFQSGDESFEIFIFVLYQSIKFSAVYYWCIFVGLFVHLSSWWVFCSHDSLLRVCETHFGSCPVVPQGLSHSWLLKQAWPWWCWLEQYSAAVVVAAEFVIASVEAVYPSVFALLQFALEGFEVLHRRWCYHHCQLLALRWDSIFWMSSLSLCRFDHGLLIKIWTKHWFHHCTREVSLLMCHA